MQGESNKRKYIQSTKYLTITMTLCIVLLLFTRNLASDLVQKLQIDDIAIMCAIWIGVGINLIIFKKETKTNEKDVLE